MPFWKRCTDVLVSALLLIVLFPLILTIAVVIDLTSSGGVLFRQRRVGLNGRVFWLHKFRTLHPETDSSNLNIKHLNERDGPCFKIENDPRATPFGGWLRASGLDELPQLWDILRGCMSIVGPRPLPELEMKGCKDWHRRRLEVNPGLTCLWQVEAREMTFDEWMSLDLIYVENLSPWLDLKILAQTPFAMLNRTRNFAKILSKSSPVIDSSPTVATVSTPDKVQVGDV